MQNENSTYDRLLALIESCAKSISPVKFQDCKKMLIIATNREVWFREGMKTILESNPGIEFIIVAQIKMKDVLDQLYQGRYKTLYWNGNYSLGILEKVKNETEIKEIDSFLFFASQPVDLRDKNFYQIGETLQKENPNIQIFSNTNGQELYEYYDISLFNQGVRVYAEMDRLVEMELSCAERGLIV